MAPAKSVNAGNKSAQASDERRRRTRLFPASTFEDALTIPAAIQKYAAGQKTRRLTIFDALGKSPDSGPSRQLVTNANAYGLASGGYQAEFLELTPEGASATAVEGKPRDLLKSRFKLAIENIAPFKGLYESLKGNRLPVANVIEDRAKELGVPAENAKECVETFLVNAKFLGILKPIAGAERIIPIEQALEELPDTASPKLSAAEPVYSKAQNEQPQGTVSEDWQNTCFYISPIGDEGTENRQHADLFLGSIIEPALEEFKLKVVRADQIGKPGMITSQIIQYIIRSKLVIADLSFHNPNVFYELALRHVCRLPTVQVIRKVDKIPFDIDQFRTIQIDTSSIYTMVPNLQTYKAEIARQVRTVLSDPDSVDNPIITYYPKLRVVLE